MSTCHLSGGGTERSELKRYADAIDLWGRRYDTVEIATELRVPESTVARWVANFRDVVRGEA